VLVVYVTFQLGGDRAGFIRWFGGLAARTAEVPGCVRFDFLMDPMHPRRGVIAEMWESTEQRDAYLVMPHHVEMVARGTAEWGMCNFETYYFRDAGDPVVACRERSEAPVSGRPEMNRLVEEEMRRLGIAPASHAGVRGGDHDGATG
jgi:quinol monooxygenase YgiN